jgi:hypothetical protein
LFYDLLSVLCELCGELLQKFKVFGTSEIPVSILYTDTRNLTPKMKNKNGKKLRVSMREFSPP